MHIWHEVMLVGVILLCGAAVENLDRYAGMKLRIAWYNMTHKEKLSPEQAHGFIVNEDVKHRFYAAGAIYLVWVALRLSTGQKIDVLTFLDIIPVSIILWFGFLAGPWLGKAVGRRDKFFDVVGRIQDDPEGTARGWGSSIMNFLNHLVNRHQRSVATAAATAASATESGAEKPQPDEDPEKGLDEFLKR